jgi:hypothetical protein
LDPPYSYNTLSKFTPLDLYVGLRGAWAVVTLCITYVLHDGCQSHSVP